jgi:hypothetical protein
MAAPQGSSGKTVAVAMGDRVGAWQNNFNEKNTPKLYLGAVLCLVLLVGLPSAR